MRSLWGRPLEATLTVCLSRRRRRRRRRHRVVAEDRSVAPMWPRRMERARTIVTMILRACVKNAPSTVTPWHEVLRVRNLYKHVTR